jgi:hypothetical protein
VHKLWDTLNALDKFSNQIVTLGTLGIFRRKNVFVMSSDQVGSLDVAERRLRHYIAIVTFLAVREFTACNHHDAWDMEIKLSWC